MVVHPGLISLIPIMQHLAITKLLGLFRLCRLVRRYEIVDLYSGIFKGDTPYNFLSFIGIVLRRTRRRVQGV
jgi:hypothetical protein